MRSIQNLLLVAGAILGFVALSSPASAFTTFTVDKEVPSSCNITGSSIPALIGAKVTYYGPTIDPKYLSSNIVLDAAGGTASGYCMVYRLPTPATGICAIHAGTGSLAGLQAVVNVTFVPGGVGVAKFHWQGDKTD
jgi:hypothetical protein